MAPHVSPPQQARQAQRPCFCRPAYLKEPQVRELVQQCVALRGLQMLRQPAQLLVGKGDAWRGGT